MGPRLKTSGVLIVLFLILLGLRPELAAITLDAFTAEKVNLPAQATTPLERRLEIIGEN